MVSAPPRSYIGLDQRFLVGQLLASHDIRMNPNCDIIYVQSTHVNAGTGKSGRDPNNPLSTVVEALTLAVASRGDVIVCLPGHVETVISAAQVAMATIGVTVLGMGTGNSRPTFNFTTAVSASVRVTAADCAIIGCLFTGSIDALTGILDIRAADFKLYDCETRDTGVTQMTDCIVTTAAADRLHIRGWKHSGATAAGGDSAITIVGGDGIVIEEFSIWGNFAEAAIENETTAATNLRIGGGRKPNYIQNGFDNALPIAILAVATTTGFIGPNLECRIGVGAGGASNTTNIEETTVAAAMTFIQPINICNNGGEVAMQTNITATTDA